MFGAFFGNYLLNKGRISREDMQRILEHMHGENLKLGVLAINLNLMTAKEVDNVHNKQAFQNKYFGEVAIKEGYLTEEQLQTLLDAQKSERLILGQAIIDEGILTYEEIEEEIELYKKEYGLSDEQFEAIRDGNIQVVARAFLLLEKEEKSQQFYTEFVTLFVKNLIRFVDRQVSIDRIQRTDTLDYKHMISQYLIGDETFFIGIASSSDRVLLDLAEKYAEATFETFNEYAIDACQEFLNVTTGLFSVNLSEQDMEYVLKPPTYVANAIIRPQTMLYRVPVHLSQGTINLVIGHLD